MLNICDFIQVYVFTTNHHLNLASTSKTVFQISIIHGIMVPSYTVSDLTLNEPQCNLYFTVQ